MDHRPLSSYRRLIMLLSHEAACTQVYNTGAYTVYVGNILAITFMIRAIWVYANAARIMEGPYFGRAVPDFPDLKALFVHIVVPYSITYPGITDVIYPFIKISCAIFCLRPGVSHGGWGVIFKTYSRGPACWAYVFHNPYKVDYN